MWNIIRGTSMIYYVSTEHGNWYRSKPALVAVGFWKALWVSPPATTAASGALKPFAVAGLNKETVIMPVACISDCCFFRDSRFCHVSCWVKNQKSNRFWMVRALGWSYWVGFYWPALNRICHLPFVICRFQAVMLYIAGVCWLSDWLYRSMVGMPFYCPRLVCCW